MLEALLRGPDEVLLLDEPDNYLDVPGKRWLEDQLGNTQKTVLFVSHDRELLARSASRIVAVEPARADPTCGCTAAVSRSFHEARAQRFERYEELRRRWDEKHAQLKRLVVDMRQYAERSDAMASRYAAAQTRLRMFEEAGPPPEPPRKQDIKMRLRGGRTGTRAITCQGLELTGLMRPFDLEVFFGERVAVLGSNGSGKSHFLRLLAGQPVNHAGTWKLGARVVARLLRPDARAPGAGGQDARRRPLGQLRAQPRRRDERAAPVRARPAGRSALRPAVGRAAGAIPDPAARAARARPRCCSTSRPTTWTWNRPRPCRRASRPTRARCWR